jgi:hypothetical protein
MALTPQQRAQRNQQIADAQAAIQRGETITAQNIVNNLIGANVGGAREALQSAIGNIRPTVVEAPIVPLDAGGGGNAGGGGGGGGTSAYEQEMLRRDQAARDEAARQQRETASSFLRGVLEQYNMGALASQVESLINQWGTNTTVIAERLRQTEPYKQRFKGLLGLQQRGITDVRNEAEYLDLESRYRGVFREAGLRDYLGTAGSQTEYDAIARIVGDFSLSVDEVRERVTDAQRVVADTPQEVRDSLQRFYGIDPNLLTQYVLDPTRTTGEIQRRANAAIVGGYAQRAGLEFGAGVSERIGEFLGGDRDIQGTQIEPQLTEIADIQRSTQRLAEIEQGDLSAETSALSALNLDQGARERVRTLQSRERARFGGRSGITTGSLSTGPGV